MQANQKGITSAIIILLGVILLVAGGLLVKQAFDGQKEAERELQRQEELAAKNNERMGSEAPAGGETADWQTYRNEEWGFEIKYSNEFSPEEAEYPSQLKDEISRKEVAFYAPGEMKGEESAALVLVIDKQPVTYAFHGTWVPIPYSEAGDDIRSEEITVNGVEFTKDYWTNAISAYALKDQNYYSLVLGIDDRDNQDRQNEKFGQMLSTLKFIGTSGSNSVKTEEIIGRADRGGSEAYIKKTTTTNTVNNLQNYQYQLIVKEEGVQRRVIDSSYGGDNSGDMKASGVRFASVKFSPKGNYLIVKNGQWESTFDSIYDLAAGRIIYKNLSAAEITDFTPDEKYFFSCGSSEMGGVNMLKVVLANGLKEKYNYGGPDVLDTGNVFFEDIECGYDKTKNAVIFDLKNPNGEQKSIEKRIEFSTATEEITEKSN
jgi:hypothetical protein